MRWRWGGLYSGRERFLQVKERKGLFILERGMGNGEWGSGLTDPAKTRPCDRVIARRVLGRVLGWVGKIFCRLPNGL